MLSLLLHLKVLSMVAFIFALPPVGFAKGAPHTRHLTSVDALLNTTCSFLHFLHLTFKNFPGM